MKIKSAPIISVFLLAAIFACFSAPAFGSGSSAATGGAGEKSAGRVVGSIGYGTGECDLVPPPVPEDDAAGSAGSAAAPFTVDRAGCFYVLDAAGRKVLRIDPAGTLSRYFSFDPSEIGEDVVSEIAVAPDGSVYLLDQSEQMIFRFSRDGKPAGTLGTLEEQSLFSGLTAIVADDASNLFAFDSRDPKVVVFSGDGNIVSRNILRVAGSGFAVSGASVFTVSLQGGRVSLSEALSGSRTELEFAPASGLQISGARLVGFDSRGRSYVKLAVSDQTGRNVENSIVLFEPHGAVSAKIPIPVDSSEGREVFMGRRFFVARDGAVATYRDEQAFFRIVEYALEK